MKFITFILVFCFSITKGQEFVITKDNSKLEFNKYKISPTGVIFKLVSGEKKEIKNEEISQIVNLRSEEEFFWKPSGVNSLEYDYSNNFCKQEKVVNGKINLYVYYTKTMGAGGTISSSGTFILEKGAQYEIILETGVWSQGKAEKVERLKNFFSDDSDALKIIQADDYKLNSDNLMRAIKIYNANNFDLVNKEKTIYHGKFASAMFYTKKKLKPESYLVINDSIKKVINNNSIVSVNLAASRGSKVCLVQGDLKYCDIVEPSSYFINYLEMLFNGNHVQFKRENKGDAQRSINFILTKK